MKHATRLMIVLSAAAVAGLAAPGMAADADGFIHGTVTTRSGSSYTGIMRWGGEEAFWDDLFHSSKVERPYARERDPRADDESSSWWEVFGRKMKISFGEEGSRVLAARFGDIRSIEVTGDKAARLEMRGGSTIAVEGYANDVGATILVHDAALGRIEIPWKQIRGVEFSAVPAGTEPPAFRLHGRVTTDSGDLEGFVQWDSEECLSTDRLDGDTLDGRVSLEMGRVRSIERRGSSSSLVVLDDGRELVLDGTNDVNSSIRGILVADPRYGRVEVPWQAFRRIELDTASGSGRGYAEFTAPRPLTGTVTTRDGARHVGRLVYDLDEAQTWEMLDGTAFELEYSIPFELVASVEPSGRSASIVTLVSGEELRLEDSQDVARRNDGVMVLGDGGAETYVPWEEIRRIELSGSLAANR